MTRSLPFIALVLFAFLANFGRTEEPKNENLALRAKAIGFRIAERGDESPRKRSTITPTPAGRPRRDISRASGISWNGTSRLSSGRWRSCNTTSSPPRWTCKRGMMQAEVGRRFNISAVPTKSCRWWCSPRSSRGRSASSESRIASAAPVLRKWRFMKSPCRRSRCWPRMRTAESSASSPTSTDRRR